MAPFGLKGDRGRKKGIRSNSVRHSFCSRFKPSKKVLYFTYFPLALGFSLCFNVCMREKRKKIKESDLQGFKYFKILTSLLEGLHGAGCQRDRAHNRTLHMDQYISLLLLYMFNPICTSLRALQQASELNKVQKKLGCARASLGSLSESARVFDSELLKEIIEELSDQMPQVSKIPGFDERKGILTAVDGTLIEAVAKMAWATWRTDRNGIKVHTQFEILKGLPVDMDVTDANGNEKTVLSLNLQPNRIYVLDRGYAKYGLFRAIQEAQSSFVCRIRDNAVWQEIQDLPVGEKAAEAGIVLDKIVTLGGDTAKAKFTPVRLIGVKCNPNTKRNHTARGGPEQGEILWIATDRFDLEAETIATIYQRRWTIEIFFRFFKHVLGCRHLLSQCENGIELQVYAAIIAGMLISLWTGRKPTLRTYEMICWYFCGMASEEELLAHIARLQKQDEAA